MLKGLIDGSLVLSQVILFYLPSSGFFTHLSSSTLHIHNYVIDRNYLTQGKLPRQTWACERKAWIQPNSSQDQIFKKIVYSGALVDIMETTDVLP